MRALIVAAVRTSGIIKLVSEVAAHHDVYIGADGGASTLLAAGIKPDLVVGDGDSLGDTDEHRLRLAGVRFETHPRDKDVTDLDLALSAARAMGVKSVTVVGATGGRLDMTLATLGSLARAADLNPEIIDPALRGWFLDAETRPSLELEGEGATVSIQAVIGSARAVSCGLKWPLDDLVLEVLGSGSASNVIVGAIAKIRVITGSVLVTSCETSSGIPPARTCCAGMEPDVLLQTPTCATLATDL